MQDAGRGRRGTHLAHAARDARCSHRCSCGRRERPAELPALAIVGGLAAARVARGLGVDARVRWPNDVVVGDRKLAGVLAELIDGPAVLLGVGMNADATADDLPVTDGLAPTSLRLEGIAASDADGARASARRGAASAQQRFDAGGFEALLTDADELDALRGLEVELLLAGGGSARGIVRGFAADGALVLDTPQGAGRAALRARRTRPRPRPATIAAVSLPILDAFVTGTDTGVGKTVVCARMAEEARARGLVPGMLKAVQTGEPTTTPCGSRRMCRGRWRRRSTTTSRRSRPRSRHALTTSRPVEIATIVEAVVELRRHCDGVIVEGSGGLLEPLVARLTFADLARRARPAGDHRLPARDAVRSTTPP